MSEYKKDFASGIFFLLFAALLYAGSFLIIASRAEAMGPQFFPRIVSLFMGILSMVQIIKTIIKMKKEEKKEKTAQVVKVNYKAIGTVVILFLYAFLIQRIGFVIMTVIYLFCQIAILLPSGVIKERKSLIVTLAVSVGAPVLIYQLFYHAFSIFLPTGMLS